MLLLNISKDRDVTITLGSMCQWSVTLTVKRVFECFLMFRENLMCFTLCLLTLVLSVDFPLERAWLPPCTSLHVFIDIDKIPLEPSLLKSEQYRSLSLSSQSLKHMYGPPLDSLLYICVSCTLKPRTGYRCSDETSSVLRRGRGSPPLNCWQKFFQYTPGYC